MAIHLQGSVLLCHQSPQLQYHLAPSVYQSVFQQHCTKSGGRGEGGGGGGGGGGRGRGEETAICPSNALQHALDKLTQCIHFQLPGEVVYWSFDLGRQLLLSRARDLPVSHFPFDWLDGVACFPDNL